MKYKFPFDITPVDPETNAELLKYFKAERTTFVHVGPKKYMYPSRYKEFACQLYNFQARPDDIWISTFPRSGTTWAQELIWLISNNLNFDAAKEKILNERFPFLELFMLFNDDIKDELLFENGNNMDYKELIEQLPTPLFDSINKIQGQRFIKTHLPFSLMPPSVMENKCKIIYVARHPKDVAVSYYHFNRMNKVLGYVGDFPRYWNYFEKGLNTYTPYWSHVKEGWENRHHSNVLFLFYEELSQNFHDAIRKVAKFLEKPLTNDQINDLLDYLKFDNFKNNEAVNGKQLQEIKVYESDFVRRGSYVGWQSEYTPELKERAQKWINDNLKDTDLKFPDI